MNKPTPATLLKSVKALMVKRGPEILTGIGIAGMITTTVLAVKETPRALRMLHDARYDKGEDLTAMEKAKACWKCYVPAAVTGVVSVACLVGSTSVSTRRTAALAAAYQLSETALSEYKDKVIETIGEKKEQTIREKIDKDHIEKNPVSKSDVIITEKGNTLCYETLSGRYFKSDLDKIRKAINEVNRSMTYDMYVSLNELYDALDLEHTAIGDSLGWNLDDGLIDIRFSSQIADNDTPCIVVDYYTPPKYNFNKLL